MIGNVKDVGAVTGILHDVYNERVRQDALKASGKFAWTCADNDVVIHGQRYSVTNSMKLAVLTEETGEAAREVCELLTAEATFLPADLRGNPQVYAAQRRLSVELIQVAAVCVAWVEALAKQGVK